MLTVTQAAQKAKEASLALAITTTEVRNNALLLIAQELEKNASRISEANSRDIEAAKAEELAQPLLKRLKLDEAKQQHVIAGLYSLIGLPDPLGKTTLARELDQDLELYRVTTPIGVIGIIFESRPDALVQIASLCLKSGNAVLLKGGREAKHTNRLLADLIISAGEQAGLPDGWLFLMESREDVDAILKLDAYISLIIPRGSNAFVKYIMDHTDIPVMGHADGICHTYVDENADLAMALRVVVDAKTQYVAVCNATETLLVHKKIAREFLPIVKVELDKRNVQLFGNEDVKSIIDVQPLGEDGYHTEYLDYKLSVCIVDSLTDAVAHINKYGSGHTDAILTQAEVNARRFIQSVDSGNVFWNCSTRFSDGFNYGFGAEVGISTSKLHARGPVGLEGLLSYKYILVGKGQTLGDYAAHTSTFDHRDLSKDCPIL